MKNFKKITALCLSVLIGLFALAGCHKKNETAMTVGDQTFTSGYYACALVYADTEARTKVDKELTTAGKDTTDVDYMKQKIDGKKYEEWVLDKAKENVIVNAAYIAKCKEKKFTLDDDRKSGAKSMAELYWSSYGYEQVFSENGVSKETFIKYTEDTYYSDLYFEKVYGDEGETPVTEEQIKNALSQHYVLADVLTGTLDGEDEEKELTRKQFETYKTTLQSGSTTFKEVYDAYNATDEESTVSNETAEGTDTTASEDGTEKPQDANAQLFGDDKTDNESAEFAEISKIAIGEVTTVEKKDSITLYVRLDPLSDPYYLSNNKESLKKVAVGIDTLKKEMTDYANKLGVKVIDSAVSIFKVKKIKYPEAQA